MQPRVQVLASKQIHDQIGGAVLAAVVVHADDVRCTELGCSATLALETRDRCRRCRQVWVQDLDSYRLAQRQVASLPDSTHPTPREKTFYPVLAADDNSRLDLHVALP